MLFSNKLSALLVATTSAVSVYAQPATVKTSATSKVSTTTAAATPSSTNILKNPSFESKGGSVLEDWQGPALTVVDKTAEDGSAYA